MALMTNAEVGASPTSAEKEFEEKAAQLVSQMTLEEKIFQLVHHAAAIPRLGVKPYVWWNEALHGVARAGIATVFPQAIGMAAAFDDDLLRQVADCVSTEARAKYHEAQRQGDFEMYKGLTLWSPNVNIFRDPRWGRGHETYGEDPYLTARLGVAYIQGLQGDDPRYLKTAACAKHVAAHSGPEGLRHEFDAEVSLKDLFETYLPAFEYCVKKANVESVMGAYSRLNGVPCCGSEWLLTDVLRKRWGFRGHIVSDCGALCDFHEGHGFTKGPVETAAVALKAGTDLECGNFYVHLMRALEQGLITEQDIDVSARRLMTTRFRLGMFEEENVPYAQIPYEVVASPEHHALSEKMAQASMVLLKNDGLLPLRRDALKTIAVIGPNADSLVALQGNYCGTPADYYTPLRGIREAAGSRIRVLYSQGSHLFRDSIDDFDSKNDRISEAVSMAQRADVVVLCLGLDSTIEGEAGDANNLYGSGDKDSLELPPCQQVLLKAVCDTGKPVVVVLLSGSALTVNYAQEHANAILQAWYPGDMGGKALAAVLFGECNPSGRLPITFYRTLEELPPFEDYSMEGRTYRYMKQEALYPFGYGLSYSAFAYRELRLSADELQAGEAMTGTVIVKNEGDRAGHEVVQLYIADRDASVRVPRWSLAEFQRIWLEPGEEKTVELTVEPRRMACITEQGEAIIEPGEFTVYVGGSQPDDRSIQLLGAKPLQASFRVTGDRLLCEN